MLSNEDKALFRSLLKTYLVELRQNLLQLHSDFFTNIELNKKFNKQISSFFEQHFHQFLLKYEKYFKSEFPEKIQKKEKKTLLKRILLCAKKYRLIFHKQNPPIEFDFVSIFASMSDNQLEKFVDYYFNLDTTNTLMENANSAVSSFRKLNENKCVFVTHLFGPTWHPTLNALKNKNWKIVCFLQHDVKLGMGSPGCVETTKIGADQVYINNFLGALYFMVKVNNSPLLFSGENYHNPNWNAINCVLLYLNISAILNTYQKYKDKFASNCFLLLYDGLKPVLENNKLIKNDLSKFYKKYLMSADKLIFNSNAERFGDYVENNYLINKPRLHFYRLCETLSDKKKQRLSFGKNNDEFHIVSITSFCNRNICAARKDTYKAVLSIINQNIHFHYYHDDDKNEINWFRSLIPKDKQHLFHTHDIIMDQQKLIDELHQYHAGFNGSDFLAFTAAIETLEDKKYQTGLINFMLSTFGTSFHVYTAAGVPPILCGMCTDSQEYYKNFSINMNLTDIDNLKNYLIKIDLKNMCENYKQYSHKANIQLHIEKLISFFQNETQKINTKNTYLPI